MATVTFKLKHSATPGEKSVIVVDFYVSREIRTTISTKEKVYESNWNGTRVKNAPDRVEINQHLTRIENELLQLWRDNKDASRDKLISSAIQIVQGTSSGQKKTLFEALDKFLEQYKAEKERKTLFRYSALKSKLEEFSKQYTFDFDSLDFNFFDRFKSYLYGCPNPNYAGCNLDWSVGLDAYTVTPSENVQRPVGLFDDTVFKYVVNLKTFLSWAEKRGYKVNPSYQTWEIIKRTHQPIALSEEELNHLENFFFKERHLSIARDYLVLESRTGARISDIQRFDQKDVISTVENGTSIQTWVYQPKKGSRLHRQTVRLQFRGYTLPAWFILAKHGFNLPKISEQKLNDNIKAACKKAGLTTPVTIERWAGSKRIVMTYPKYDCISTHTGKKTAITLMAQKGIPLPLISELCATTIQTIIKHYIGKTDSKVMGEYLDKAGSGSESLMKAI